MALQPRAALPEAAVAAADAPWARGGALAAVAVAFTGTFFVSPLFKESFKEPETWEAVHRILVAEVRPEQSTWALRASRRDGAQQLCFQTAPGGARGAASTVLRTGAGAAQN